MRSGPLSRHGLATATTAVFADGYGWLDVVPGQPAWKFELVFDTMPSL